MDFGIQVLLICVLFGSLNAQETGINTIKSRIYQSIIEDHLNAPSNDTIEDFDENINQISSDFDGEKWSFIQYSDVSREGFDNRIHLNNLVKLLLLTKAMPQNILKTNPYSKRSLMDCTFGVKMIL